MDEKGAYLVRITKSAFEENPQIQRILKERGGYLEREQTFDSEEAAELEADRLSILGKKELRLQSAEHDSTEYHAYINSTGKSSGGFGRTTRNATSGWLYKRKQAIERDNRECQKCGSLGGEEGEIELHVDHITPKSDGGTDDLDNLRTLCRDCHMDVHYSVPDAPRVPVGELADTISRIAADAEVPAFCHRKLYFWLSEVLDARVSGKDVAHALDDLVRYDRFEHTVVENVHEERETGRQRVSEYDIYYSTPGVPNPERLSYNGGVRYDDYLVRRGEINTARPDKPGLSDFL